MSLFRRGPKLDTSAYFGALTHGTLEEFLAIHEPQHVRAEYSSGTPLTLALSNGDPATRVAIAARLLDDGADPAARNPLHVLIARPQHDFALEAKLIERLLDAGANVNDRTADGMTVIERTAGHMRFEDSDLQPFYDVLLARPDLDLDGPGLDGRPILVNLRKLPPPKRAAFLEQVERLVAARG